MNGHFASRYINPDGSWKNQTEMYNTAADISPTGAQMPRAVGLAYASVLYRGLKELKLFTEFSKDGNEVTFTSIGNASTSEGMFWESVNAIGVLQAPAVITVYDDGYGISVPNQFQMVKENIHSILQGFQREMGSTLKNQRGYELYQVRGWDYPALIETFASAAEIAREYHIPPVVYASAETHSSVRKAAELLGIGTAGLRLVTVRADFTIDMDALAAAIAADRAAGRVPFFVRTTVGTTSSNAIDPMAEIGQVCAREGVWLHVDAAMSGTAALCPEFRWIHAGLEHADSYCFNPHKWMLTNFDCDCFYVADRASLIGALGILPEYLRNQASASGRVIDYRDWHVPLGRRFRALKLWFVIRWYGVEGLRAHVAVAPGRCRS